MRGAGELGLGRPSAVPVAADSLDGAVGVDLRDDGHVVGHAAAGVVEDHRVAEARGGRAMSRGSARRCRSCRPRHRARWCRRPPGPTPTARSRRTSTRASRRCRCSSSRRLCPPALFVEQAPLPTLARAMLAMVAPTIGFTGGAPASGAAASPAPASFFGVGTPASLASGGGAASSLAGVTPASWADGVGFSSGLPVGAAPHPASIAAASAKHAGSPRIVMQLRGSRRCAEAQNRQTGDVVARRVAVRHERLVRRCEVPLAYPAISPLAMTTSRS